MAENTVRKQRGKPFLPGQSGNPAGKPPGARNRATVLAQALFDGEAETLTRKLIELAKAGDMQALRVCVDRLCPPLKAQAAPVQVEIPNTECMSDIANAFIKAAADGRLPPDVAAQLVSAVGTLARVVEIDELKARLAALEAAVSKNKENHEWKSNRRFTVNYHQNNGLLPHFCRSIEMIQLKLIDCLRVHQAEAVTGRQSWQLARR